VKPKRITALAIGLAVMLTLFVSGSVFGCILDESVSCVFPSPDVLRISGGGAGRSNAMLGPDTELVRLQSDLIAFVTAKLRGDTPNSTSELIALSQQLPQKSDAELANLLSLAKTLDTGNTPLHTRRIEMIVQEQTRRQNERLAQKLAQQQAAARLAAQRAAAAAQPVPAAPAPAIPGSLDPYNAPAPSATEVYIKPLSSVWYSADDRGRRLSIWMNANHQSGLEVAIYAPDQTDVWNTRPIGVGAPGQGFDFFWTGRSRMKGTYRIRITNTNDFSVPYTLGAQAVSDKNGDLCKDCHGNIEDEWDRCEHDGSFCEDLKDQYKN
jgi:hypothetical protein